MLTLVIALPVRYSSACTKIPKKRRQRPASFCVVAVDEDGKSQSHFAFKPRRSVCRGCSIRSLTDHRCLCW